MKEIDQLREELLEMRNDYSLAKIAELSQNANLLIDKLNDKEFFDKSGLSEIKTAIETLSSGLSKITVDLAPVLKIASDIASSNRAMLEQVAKMVKPESNEEKYREIIRMVLDALKENTELVRKMSKAPEIYVPSDAPKQWDFKIVRGEGGEMKSIKATAN